MVRGRGGGSTPEYMRYTLYKYGFMGTKEEGATRGDVVI